MAKGKLYSSNDGEFFSEVNYRLYSDSPAGWWGELTLVEYKRIGDDEGYIIELEDKRKGKCYLMQRVNRAVSGVPPRYTYRFNGGGLLK